MKKFSKVSTNFVCIFRGHDMSIDDPLSCFFYQLPYLLEDIKFAYITLFLLIIILLVSIFGDIKESYRWFILNQTFWDLFIIYDSICDTPVSLADGEYPTCIYSLNGLNNTLFTNLIIDLFKNITFNGMFAPLFLLIFSRFLTMYFNRFYGHFSSKSRNLFLMIFCFQFLYLLILNIPDWIMDFMSEADSQAQKICEMLYCPGWSECKKPKLFDKCLKPLYVAKWWQTPLLLIPNLSAPFLLLTANILAIFVIIKVGSQFKFQAKNNRKNLMTSIKITIVITFQCIFLTFLSLASIYYTYVNYLSTYFNITFPSWIGYLSRNYTIQWLCVIRVFCDSIIMLIILTEYRRNIVNFMVFIFHLLRKPKSAYIKLTSRFITSSSTSVTILSTTTTNGGNRRK